MARVERSAFLYLDPKKPKTRFAQCATCMMWTGPEKRRCTIHGPDLEVKGGDTCGFYVHGMPMPDAHAMKSVTPKESGFERRDVRCENCVFFDAKRSRCKLYERLNRDAPELFNLDPNVDPQGCCNANVKSVPTMGDLTRG